VEAEVETEVDGAFQNHASLKVEGRWMTDRCGYRNGQLHRMQSIVGLGGLRIIYCSRTVLLAVPDPGES
jgi:hypothetical protein